MIYPSGDTIEQKVRSRYTLVVLAAKRAKQIKEGAPILIDTESTNPLTIAMEEIAAGKVTVTEAVIAPGKSAPEETTTPQAPSPASLLGADITDEQLAEEDDTAELASDEFDETPLNVQDQATEGLAAASGSNVSDELAA